MLAAKLDDLNSKPMYHPLFGYCSRYSVDRLLQPGEVVSSVVAEARPEAGFFEEEYKSGANKEIELIVSRGKRQTEEEDEEKEERYRDIRVFFEERSMMVLFLFKKLYRRINPSSASTHFSSSASTSFPY